MRHFIIATKEAEKFLSNVEASVGEGRKHLIELIKDCLEYNYRYSEISINVLSDTTLWNKLLPEYLHYIGVSDWEKDPHHPTGDAYLTVCKHM